MVLTELAITKKRQYSGGIRIQFADEYTFFPDSNGIRDGSAAIGFCRDRAGGAVGRSGILAVDATASTVGQVLDGVPRALA